MATKRLFTRKKNRRWSFPLTLLLFFILLTLITQVGGLVLIFCLPMIISVHKSSTRFKFVIHLTFFLIVYLVAVGLIVPNVAPIFGRVSLPWMAAEETPLKPVNLVYGLCFRNYVRSWVKEEVVEAARKMSQKYPGGILVYYDAGFPFFDFFPMLPHLGHSMGTSIDLGFFYRNRVTKKPAPPPSPIGYFAYEQPGPGEERPGQGDKSWRRWDLPWIQSYFDHTEMDPERTGYLLRLLAASPKIKFIYLEPHLKKRLKIDSPKIRFQGWNAARHDDHIHIEFAGP